MLDTAIAFIYDLDKGIRRTALSVSLLTGDKHAHTFMGKVVNRGESYPIGGASVSAYFIRADGVTVPIKGTVQDDTMLVTLPESCYRVAGRFQLVIKLALNDQIITVFWGDGTMSSAQTDALLDEDGVVPSLDALLAQIAATERAADEATDAAYAADLATQTALSASGRAAAAAAAMEGLTATASTLPTGSAAAVSVSKAASGFVLAFGLPRGEKGEKGDTGPAGKDGTGSVSSVNGIASVQGNVTLTASDVGALPASAAAADASALGGRLPAYYLPVHNLLDNSNLTWPVNQRGILYMTTYGYCIDRWIVNGLEDVPVVVQDGGVVLGAASAMLQKIERPERLVGKTLTLAAMDAAGVLRMVSGTYGGAEQAVEGVQDGCLLRLYHDGTDAAWLMQNYDATSKTVVWCALYEGAYTAATLPPYVPKGYAAELAACQRRYHVYATESARPLDALDCCPPMTLAPGQSAVAQGAIVVGGRTLYYNSTDL